MVSFTEENYLKALLNLSDESGEVGVNELSKHLKIKMPTVNSMMKKLSEKKMVYYESYKPLRLTDEGKRRAALVVRKHRLTEMFLYKEMGFGWEEVHAIAEQVEHIQSPAFFEKMDELLDYPKVDPHGSPIPDKYGNIEGYNYKNLSECKAGNKVELCAVTHSSTDFLKFLNSRELSLGIKIEILKIEKYDNGMTVSYDLRTNEMLSNLVCEKLLVKVIKG